MNCLGSANGESAEAFMFLGLTFDRVLPLVLVSILHHDIRLPTPMGFAIVRMPNDSNLNVRDISVERPAACYARRVDLDIRTYLPVSAASVKSARTCNTKC